MSDRDGDSPLFIEQIEIGPMQNFTYVVGSETTREVALVDPAWDIDGLLEHVESAGPQAGRRAGHPLPRRTTAGAGCAGTTSRGWRSSSGSGASRSTCTGRRRTGSAR